MSAHTEDCTYLPEDGQWLSPAPAGCAAPEEHTAAPLKFTSPMPPTTRYAELRLVVVESPYGSRPDGTRAPAKEVEENAQYLAECLADSLARGEAPFASHRLYPGVLDDSDPEDRALGMRAGFAWGDRADLVAVYVDRGVTPGMRAGTDRATARGARVVYRTLACPGVDFVVAPPVIEPP